MAVAPAAVAPVAARLAAEAAAEAAAPGKNIITGFAGDFCSIAQNSIASLVTPRNYMI